MRVRYGRYPDFATGPPIIPPPITPTTLADRDPKNPNLSLSKTRVDIQRTLANTTPGQKLLFPGGGGLGRVLLLLLLLPPWLVAVLSPGDPSSLSHNSLSSYGGGSVCQGLCGLCDQH